MRLPCPWSIETMGSVVPARSQHRASPVSGFREACHFIMGSVCQLLEGPELEGLAPEIADKLGLGLRCGCCRSHRLKPQCPPLLLCCFLSPSFMCPGSNIPSWL